MFGDTKFAKSHDSAWVGETAAGLEYGAKTDGFCFKVVLCFTKNDIFGLKLMLFVLQMRDFAGTERSSARSRHVSWIYRESQWVTMG